MLAQYIVKVNRKMVSGVLEGGGGGYLGLLDPVLS